MEELEYSVEILPSAEEDLSNIYNKKTEIKADLPKHFAEACEFLGLETE